MKFKRLVHDGNIAHTTGFIQELPDVNSWDFIEAFYPNYYKCDDIMYHDDLACYLDGEITKKGFCTRVGYEENRPKARLQIEHDNMQAKFKLEALENFYRMIKEQEIEIVKDEGYFKITSVHRDDLLDAGISIEDIDLLNDSDMKTIENKMSNAYIENSYWIDLGIIAEYIISEKKKRQE